jgi:hypothetical protein
MIAVRVVTGRREFPDCPRRMGDAGCADELDRHDVILVAMQDEDGTADSAREAVKAGWTDSESREGCDPAYPASRRTWSLTPTYEIANVQEAVPAVVDYRDTQGAPATSWRKEAAGEHDRVHAVGLRSCHPKRLHATFGMPNED